MDAADGKKYTFLCYWIELSWQRLSVLLRAQMRTPMAVSVHLQFIKQPCVETLNLQVTALQRSSSTQVQFIYELVEFIDLRDEICNRIDQMTHSGQIPTPTSKLHVSKGQGATYRA